MNKVYCVETKRFQNQDNVKEWGYQTPNGFIDHKEYRTLKNKGNL